MQVLQSSWEKIPLGEGVRKICNLLLIGHGAALLLVFNAKVDGVGLNLQGIAWACGAGLIAAAIGLVSAHYHDELLEYPMRPTESEAHRKKMLGRAVGWTSIGMLLSGVLFVGALIVAISTLGQDAVV